MIEEIERYNVLAEEIRQLRTELKWQSERLAPKCEVKGPFEFDWGIACYIVKGKRVTPEFIEMIAEFGPSVEFLRQEMRQGVVAQDIGKVFDRMEKRFEETEKAAQGRYERLLTLISVLHDAKAKPARPVRKQSKRK